MVRKLLVSSVAVAAGLASTVALADPPPHAAVWKKRGYHAAPYYPAGYGRAEYDYGRVIDVEPIVRRVRISEPREECWDEVYYERERRGGTAGGTILGGLIGAAVGNQIGSGDGRRAATVAGALIGSAIGNDAAARRQGGDRSRQVSEERCEVRYEDRWEERVEGYDVTYEYAGREYRTRTDRDPGDRIEIRVDVAPVRRY